MFRSITGGPFGTSRHGSEVDFRVPTVNVSQHADYYLTVGENLPMIDRHTYLGLGKPLQKTQRPGYAIRGLKKGDLGFVKIDRSC